MGDPVRGAIDRAFDFFDGVADKADHVLNRAKRSENAISAMRERRDPDERAAATSSPPATTALVRSRYKIVEAVDAETSVTLWIVVDTQSAERAECNSRAMADRLVASLEASR